MNNFQPFWCMLLGDQAGMRVSSRLCIAIHHALRYTAAMGYDVEDIKPEGEVGKWRIDRGLRVWLRNEEDEETTSAEYATIILRYQKSQIVENGEARDIVRWANILYEQGSMRELYRWRLVRDLLQYPKHFRGPQSDS